MGLKCSDIKVVRFLRCDNNRVKRVGLNYLLYMRQDWIFFKCDTKKVKGVPGFSGARSRLEVESSCLENCS